MIGAQVCALVRYTILARMLGPAELGLIVTLLLTAQFFDSITDSGADRFLVQDARGDEPSAQRMVQFMYVMRGVSTAAALFLLARPLAGFYGQPELTSALMALAVVPLTVGFMHLDLRRLQRHHDFRSEAVTLLGAEIASLIGTGIAALILKNHFAIIFGLGIRAVIVVLLSHLTAQRRYSLGLEKEHAQRLFAFGLPLMLNGLLLFFGSQSDRLVIGRELGVEELGRYSSILMLVFYPTGTLQRFVSGMFMPLVAAERRGEGGSAARDLCAFVLLISILIVCGFAVVAPFATVILFGPAFAHGLLVVALIGILQTSRFMRIWPVTVALGIGKSSIVLINNVARLVAVPAGVAAAFIFRRLELILLGFILGELFALVVGAVLVNRDRQVPLRSDFDRVGLFVLVCLAVSAVAGGLQWGLAPLWIVGVVGILAASLLLVTREQKAIRDGAGVLLRFIPGRRRR
jgi:O-antigen/teichoic acid export membrane protein